MRQSISNWWSVRTLREQRLVQAMLVLAALLLVWLLLIRPMGNALEAARMRHGNAVDALADARSRTPAVISRRPGIVAPVPVDSFVSRSATEAGFGDARIAGRGPRAATIFIPNARPPAFFAWIRQLEQSGLEIASLRARANSDRTIAVEAALRTRP